MLGDYVFDPIFPASWIIALGTVVGLLTILNYVRTRRDIGFIRRYALMIFRLAVVVGIVIALLRPMVLQTSEVADSRAIFSVIVDTSQSMNTTDMDEGSRLDAVTRSLRAIRTGALRELGEHYDVKFFTFSDSLRPAIFEQLVELDKAEGRHTDIASALLNAANAAPGQRKAGVLLVSDGRESDAGDALRTTEYLKTLGLPVWTSTVGTETKTKDLYVTARLNQNFVFRDQEASIRVDLGHSGYQGWYAKVELLREGETVATQQVKISSASERLRFPIRESARGAFQYTVKVEPLRGEASTSNNERSVFVQVVDEKSKVLLVEGEPYWDSKFLLRALQADPNLEVTAVFFVRESPRKFFTITQHPATSSGRRRGDTNLPRTKEDLFKYDCVILGRNVDSMYTADELKLFKAYLEERGGNVIFARGKAYGLRSEVLAQIEPMVWDDTGLSAARFELTPAGAVSPVFNFGEGRSADVVIRELPEMLSITRVLNEKSLSIILARGVTGDASEEIAAIAYQRYGKGKVMSIGTTGLWRWAFMPAELERYDEIYARFWAQMIRWLVYGSDFLPGKDIAFRTDKLSYNLGEPVPLVVQTKLIPEGQYTPRIEIAAPGGATTTIEPERDSEAGLTYSAAFMPEEEGEYSATLHNNVGNPKEETVRFTVYADSLETRFVASNRPLMAHIAAVSGGEELPLDRWDELPRLVTDFELSTRQETKPEDAWDTRSFFFALMALLALEWFVRRRTGLV